MEYCVPGELYVIGNENPKNIHTYREILNKLIGISSLDPKSLEIRTNSNYVRPTNVPRLIGDASKFKNLTKWEPQIPFEQILVDTLDYWRDFVKRGLY